MRWIVLAIVVTLSMGWIHGSIYSSGTLETNTNGNLLTNVNGDLVTR